MVSVVCYVCGGGSNMIWTVHTGHVVSVVCSVNLIYWIMYMWSVLVLCMLVCSNIVIGRYILDMRSVLCVSYVYGGI